MDTPPSIPPIFTVTNHHVSSCGAPPTVTDAGDPYLGYFENVFGEQFIVKIERTPDGQAREAVLWCGDAGWEHPYPLVNGRPVDLIVSDEESDWLATCWRTAVKPAASDPAVKQSAPIDLTDIAQFIQYELDKLQEQDRDSDPRLGAVGLMWEAVHFARYVIIGDLVTAADKLRLVEKWIADYRRRVSPAERGVVSAETDAAATDSDVSAA